MKRTITIAALALLCAGCAASAGSNDAPTAAAAPAPAGASAADVIAGRQAAFNLSGVAMGAMKSAIDANAAPNTQAFNSRALARWAHTLPRMFPAGTGAEAGVPTKAKPEIWSDRAGFEAKAAEYAAAAERLNELARAGDSAGFAAQWTVVRQTCQSCHTPYRAD
ncbi:MAG TPA: cytochrome c [Brevundimonas sp.]|nr:cytochrome c [Brevundimonas sp.]